MTFLLFLVLSIYATRKFEVWLYREDPLVTQYVEPNGISAQEFIDFQQTGLMLAFGVVNYYTNEPLDDPNFIEWQIRIDEYKGNKKVGSTNLKTRICQDSDFEKFFEFRDGEAAIVE
jgi:hypothetical protein